MSLPFNGEMNGSGLNCYCGHCDARVTVQLKGANIKQRVVSSPVKPLPAQGPTPPPAAPRDQTKRWRGGWPAHNPSTTGHHHRGHPTCPNPPQAPRKQERHSPPFFFFFFFFFFFVVCPLQFPRQGLYSHHNRDNTGSLTTRPPGNFHLSPFYRGRP